MQVNSRNQSPQRDTPSPNNRIESAILGMASAVQSLVERLGTVESRIGSIEQRDRTYTVNQERPPRSVPNVVQANPVAQPHLHGNNSDIEQEHNGNDVRANGQQNHFRRVPIHKWGFHFSANSKLEIPKEKDTRAFLKRLEIFRDAEDVTYAELFQKFHYLLTDSALDWYTQYRNEFMQWNGLKAGFLKQYTTPLSKFVTAAKLASRKQQRTESASDYIASIIRDFDEMEVNDEEERISIVQNGLLPDLRSRAMSRDWRSVQEMSIWLRKTETADKLYGQPPQQPFVRKFFTKRPTMAIAAQEKELYEEVFCEESEADEMIEIGESQCNAMNRRNFSNKKSGQTATPEAKQRKSVCYNCKSNQHYFNDCDKPIDRIFCLRCGKEEVLAPNCECKKIREQPKNGISGAAMAADHCDESNLNPQ